MKKIRLSNGGVYVVTPDLWECYTIPKSQEMLNDFCEWCRENEHLMDSGGRITSRLVREEWDRGLAARIKDAARYRRCELKEGGGIYVG